MGTFGKSFSRELGKNTGKVISNAVFGDKWSTPYRSANGKNSASVKAAEIRAQQQKTQAEAQREIAEIEYKTQMEKIKLEQKFEQQKNEDRVIEDIISANFNTDKDEIFQILSDLMSLSESSDSKNIQKAAIEKINAGIFKLQQIGAIEEANYFKQKFKDKSDVRDKKLLHLNDQIHKFKNLSMIGFGVFVLGFLLRLWKETEKMGSPGFEFEIEKVKFPGIAFLLIISGITVTSIGVRKYLQLKKEQNNF
jgi:hypothetical protein